MARLQVNPAHSPAAVILVRTATAALLFVHGVARLAASGVTPFGAWLGSIGFPFGPAIASAITAFEILAPPVWGLGRLVRPLCAVHALILLAGVLLVHAPSGWFVVGLGRNGAEYSVLLLVCLAAAAWAAPDS